MWEWYLIGLSLGLGIGLGALLAALLAPRRALVVLVAVVAAGLGAVVGYAIGGWHEAVAGGMGPERQPTPSHTLEHGSGLGGGLAQPPPPLGQPILDDRRMQPRRSG